MTTKILQSSCASVSHERPPDLPSREVLPAAHRITGVDLAVAVGVKRLQPNRTGTLKAQYLDRGPLGGAMIPYPIRCWHAIQGGARMAIVGSSVAP